jgi:drug/metabolite transporter (DMT)-like permease
MALMAVILFTGYFVASKRIRESVSTVAYMACVHLAAAVVVTPVALVHGLEVAALSTADWARILTIVVTSGVGAHMLINWAHPYVKVSVSPSSSSSPPSSPPSPPGSSSTNPHRAQLLGGAVPWRPSSP